MSSRGDEEREAARLERERRRAERAAATTAQPETPAEREPIFAQDGEELERRRAEHEHDEEHATGQLVTDEHVLTDEHDLPGDGYAGGSSEDDEDDEGEDHEPAVGTRRVSRLHRQQSTPKPPRPPRKPRRPPRSGKRGRRWFGRVFALAAILLAAAAIWFLIELFQPFHGSGHGIVRVTIPAHSSASQIGDILKHDGVISSSFFFNVRATIGSDRSDLRSGTYLMKQDMSYSDVLTELTKPPKGAKVSDLTITEGRTRRQIDALLRSQHVKGSYFADTRRSKLLDPHAYGAPRNIGSLEGFLFPSTYQLREPVSIGALVSDQLKTFKQRFKGVNLSYAKRKNLTPYDVLIIASMIEAESATEHDRPLVAAVIYNRLAKGMPLQIDATTRYATGNYSKPLTESELNSQSPYNTRVHKGLPPTPIGNAGMASIEAAAHPANKNYLYFVVKPCGNGEQTFTASYSQFLKDEQRYQSARNARSGRSPERC